MTPTSESLLDFSSIDKNHAWLLESSDDFEKYFPIMGDNWQAHPLLWDLWVAMQEIQNRN